MHRPVVTPTHWNSFFPISMPAKRLPPFEVPQLHGSLDSPVVVRMMQTSPPMTRGLFSPLFFFLEIDFSFPIAVFFFFIIGSEPHVSPICEASGFYFSAPLIRVGVKVARSTYSPSPPLRFSRFEEISLF